MAKVKGFKTKALNAEDNIFTALGFDLTTSANLRLRAELMSSEFGGHSYRELSIKLSGVISGYS